MTVHERAFLLGFAACAAMNLAWTFVRSFIGTFRNARARCDSCGAPATRHMTGDHGAMHACAEHFDPVLRAFIDRLVVKR